MRNRFAWPMMIASLVLMAVASSAKAQSEPDCSHESLNRQPTLDAMLAHAQDCANRGFVSTLQVAGNMVEAGFRDNPPDWRKAAEIYERIIDRNESLDYASYGARRWEGLLQMLVENFESGNPQIGWPQDFERAWKYQARLVNRLSREPSVTAQDLAALRGRLAQLEAKRDLARRRSGNWSGDVAALSQINLTTLLERDLGAQRLEAEGFAGVITAIDVFEPEGLPLVGYHFDVDVYATNEIPGEFAGVCLVIRNTDETDAADFAVGMLYEHFRTGRTRQTYGPYPGRYRLIPKEGRDYAPLPWMVNTRPQSIRYEFRPVTDPTLCTLDM